jgi:hypothetical protein
MNHRPPTAHHPAQLRKCRHQHPFYSLAYMHLMRPKGCAKMRSGLAVKCWGEQGHLRYAFLPLIALVRCPHVSRIAGVRNAIFSERGSPRPQHRPEQTHQGSGGHLECYEATRTTGSRAGQGCPTSSLRANFRYSAFLLLPVTKIHFTQIPLQP